MVDGRSVVRQAESFRNLTLRLDARTNAFAVVNAGSRLVQLDRVGLAALPAPPFRPDPTGTVGDQPGGPVPASGSIFSVTVDPDGTGTLNATITPLTFHYTGTISFAALGPLLEAAIRGAANDPAATDLVPAAARRRDGPVCRRPVPRPARPFRRSLRSRRQDHLWWSGRTRAGALRRGASSRTRSCCSRPSRGRTAGPSVARSFAVRSWPRTGSTRSRT